MRIEENYDKWRAEGRWVRANFWFGFDVTHSWMMGTENTLIAMMEEPELEDFVVTSIGELNENKNTFRLLEVIKNTENQNIKYLVCGQGPLKEKFEKKIEIFCQGAGNINILLMVIIFILAGAFAQVAKDMGAVDSTVNLSLSILIY